MTVYAISGVADGSGDLSDDWRLTHLMLGEACHGQGLLGTLVPPARVMLFGGQTRGSGTLADGLTTNISGNISGSGDLAVATLFCTWPNAGVLRGLGQLRESAPEAMVGCGHLVGLLVVEQAPLPYGDVPTYPSFSWGYSLTRGDLQLFLTDGLGNPVSPVRVHYSLFQVLPGGLNNEPRRLIGPYDREPVMDSVGCYYATGTLGDFGQPGTWVISWRYQISPFEPVEVSEQTFLVKG